jgi:hypothetical protein
MQRWLAGIQRLSQLCIGEVELVVEPLERLELSDDVAIVTSSTGSLSKNMTLAYASTSL